MRTLFGDYGITDWDICKDEPQINLGKYLGNNQIDVASLYPKHFEILTTNPYWSKHPILENYRKYESEQWREEKEKNMNNYALENAKRTIKLIGEIKQLKVLIETRRDKYIDAYFIDPFHLDKTCLIVIDVEELNFGWASTLDEFIRNHFDKDNPLYTSTDLEFKEYCKADVEMTKLMLNSIYSAKGTHRATYVSHKVPKIKDVKFNGPATIVFWSDDTKTVVKAHNEDVDYEKGLAMAIAKKALGNKGNYFNEFKKWLPEEEKKPVRQELGKIIAMEEEGEGFRFSVDFTDEEAKRKFERMFYKPRVGSFEFISKEDTIKEAEIAKAKEESLEAQDAYLKAMDALIDFSQGE